MKKYLLIVLACGLMLVSFNSCHKNECYYCYLVENGWWEPDTLSTYSQGFIYKKMRPEEKCAEEKQELDSISEYTRDLNCDCGWEPE